MYTVSELSIKFVSCHEAIVRRFYANNARMAGSCYGFQRAAQEKEHVEVARGMRVFDA